MVVLFTGKKFKKFSKPKLPTLIVMFNNIDKYGLNSKHSKRVQEFYTRRFQVLTSTYRLETSDLAPDYGNIHYDEDLMKIVADGLYILKIINFPIVRFNRYKVRFTNPNIKENWLKNPTIPYGILVTLQQETQLREYITEALICL